MATAETPTHALDVEIEDRRSIRIDGLAYALKTSNDLSFGDWRRFASLYNRVIAIEGQTSISKADDVELMQAIGQAIQMVVVDLPDKTLQRLGYSTRTAIVATFVKLSGRGLSFRGAIAAEATPAAPASPGQPSSPGSRGSMAASRRRGKPTSRSARSTTAGVK